MPCYGAPELQRTYSLDKLARRGVDGRGTTTALIMPYRNPAFVHDVTVHSREYGLGNKPDVTVIRHICTVEPLTASAARRPPTRRNAEHSDASPADPLLIVVSGRPGAGATTAALTFLSSLIRDDLGDLHIDLGHTNPPRDVGPILHDVLIGAGVLTDQVPLGTDARTAWWRSVAKGPPLMLIDGVVKAAQVRPLLPAIFPPGGGARWS